MDYNALMKLLGVKAGDEGNGTNTNSNESGPNTSGIPGITLGNPGTLWKGAQRPGQWTPPQFTQTYGQFGSPFPSMGEQVGRSIYGGIQGQGYTPAWYQSVLPPHGSSSRQIDKAQYNVLLGQQPNPTRGGFDPNPNRYMQIGTGYPLNGNVPRDQRTVSNVDMASNPFIGLGAGQQQPQQQPTQQPTQQPQTPFPGAGPSGPGITPMPAPQQQQGMGLLGRFQQMGITPAMVQGLLGRMSK